MNTLNTMNTMSAVDNKYIDALSEFIDSHNSSNPEHFIDDSHGIHHMLTVLYHASNALCLVDSTEKEKTKVKLAALLHDIDDAKYFPNNKNYENARQILSNTVSDKDELSCSDIDDIIKMISWVSSSKNGDVIPEEARNKEYLLYPRYADRLEALGITGIWRTLEYTLKKGAPLFTRDTLKAHNEEDLFTNIATPERYKQYSGASSSMMDHFYDKLLRLGVYPIRNKYFDSETEKRQQPLIDIALYFGKNSITEAELENYTRDFIKKHTDNKNLI